MAPFAPLGFTTPGPCSKPKENRGFDLAFTLHMPHLYLTCNLYITFTLDVTLPYLYLNIPYHYIHLAFTLHLPHLYLTYNLYVTFTLDVTLPYLYRTIPYHYIHLAFTLHMPHIYLTCNL